MKESGAFNGLLSLKDTEGYRYWMMDPHESKAGLGGSREESSYPEALEFRGSLVPQFLQKSASGGFTVLQFGQVLSATCRVSSWVVVRVLCANLEPVPPRNPQTGTARARNSTVSPPTFTGSFRALITT